MYTNCDEIFKITIPAVRIAVAKSLSKKYGMSQSDIARSMGTTQAAISKYFSGDYSDKIARVERIVERERSLREITTMAASKKNKGNIAQSIDRLASSGYLVKETLKII
jgi:predicted transcriptional regulator